MPRRSDDRDLPVEWIDLSGDLSNAGAVRVRRVRWRWLVISLAAVATASVAVAVVVGHRRHGPAQTQTLPASAGGAFPQTIRLKHRVLAVPKNWDLIARGPQLVRIGLGTGAVTGTGVPTLQSSGPSFLIVEAHDVIIRPLDFVPGYIVADGEPARLLTGPLGDGGPAFPGPDGEVWVAVDGTSRRMALIGANGVPTGESIDSTNTFPVGDDGTGLLVMNDSSGTYLAGGDTRELITTGNLLAIGPTRWLTAEQTPGRCELVVTDRATKAAHTLGATTCTRDVPFPGVISPNGRTAAMIVETAPGVDAIHLVDMRSGSDHRLRQRPSFGDGSNGHLVWTPDSRTLFFLTLEGQIDITDPHGSRVSPLPLDLREMTAQIAIRVN